MTSAPHLPFEVVTDGQRLAAVVEQLTRQPRIALDTESNGFHRYPEQVCLVQVATREGAFIIDPLAIDDMAPLGRLLAEVAAEKVLHSADYDLRSLDRQWGFHIGNLYDSSIAAHFLGMDRLGLATVVQELLGWSLAKERRLQRADWGLRPLSEPALEYAATDVRHLLDLREALGERLEALGRAEWVAEECARLSEVRHSPPDRETAFLSVKGSGALDGRGLAVLRALCAVREAEALRRGRPPFRVLPDGALLYLAAQPEAKLAEVPGLGRAALGRLGKGLRRALEEGMQAPLVQRPRRPRLWPAPGEAARLRDLKAWRSGEGTRLGLDPALLWPTASLERLARAPATLGAELQALEVREWQRRHIAPSLRAGLAALASP